MSRRTLSLADWQAQAGKTEVSTSTQKNTPETLVYSTEGGKPAAEKPAKAMGQAFADGKIRLQRQTKSRGGKSVIIITGIPATHDELQALCKQLKQRCACGGSVKDGSILLQNDQRPQVESALQALGYTTVWAGG